ncbi:unnamed protein product [Cuscuta epithymum]|uniref:Uncharacterized protein n=1 Tax=Cuscuta epithymum TaxID=186058 RepID=A0AAV0CW86_9ASTE|nr:unnamed protein product [Cuscuta epithymum]
MESAAGSSQTPSGRTERGGRSYSGGSDDEWVEQTGVAAFPGELRYQPAGFSTIEPSFSKSGEVGCPPAELKIRAGGNSSAESSAVEEPYHFTGFSDVPSPATALNVEEHQPQNALAQPYYADDILSPYQDHYQNESPAIAIPLRFHDPNHSLGEVRMFLLGL